MKCLSLSILCFCVLFFAVLAGEADAAEVHKLYEAEVPVADQQDAARRQAMREGLADVLLRLTGSASVVQSAPATELLGDASRFVQQYRYQNFRTSADAPLQSGIWLSFDARTLNQALQQHGLPVWGSTRPLMLLWLASEAGTQRQLVSAAESADWPVLEKTARRRGIPLRLPLLDLEDQSRIRVTDVWGGFQTAVRRASERYRPQAILLARLYQEQPGRWRAHWSLLLDSETLQWESMADSADEALAAGIEGSADRIAARFVRSGPAADDMGRLPLRIHDVDGFAGYARVMTYLQALDGVRAVRVGRVEPTVLNLELDLKESAESVLRIMRLGTVLAVENAGLPDGAANEYRLLP